MNPETRVLGSTRAAVASIALGPCPARLVIKQILIDRVQEPQPRSKLREEAADSAFGVRSAQQPQQGQTDQRQGAGGGYSRGRVHVADDKAVQPHKVV